VQYILHAHVVEARANVIYGNLTREITMSYLAARYVQSIINIPSA